MVSLFVELDRVSWTVLLAGLGGDRLAHRGP